MYVQKYDAFFKHYTLNVFQIQKLWTYSEIALLSARLRMNFKLQPWSKHRPKKREKKTLKVLTEKINMYNLIASSKCIQLKTI